MELGQCISRSCKIRGTSKAPADLEPKSDGKHNPRSDINAPAAGSAEGQGVFNAGRSRSSGLCDDIKTESVKSCCKSGSRKRHFSVTSKLLTAAMACVAPNGNSEA